MTITGTSYLGQTFRLECVIKCLIRYFSQPKYVVGTWKKSLNKMVLLSIQNIEDRT